MVDRVVNSSRRVTCRHGNDMNIEFLSTMTETGSTITGTETVCPSCLREASGEHLPHATPAE